MKKNIIDLVIKYGSCRSLWLCAIGNESTLRIKRLEKLESAYFDRILKATINIRDKEV